MTQKPAGKLLASFLRKCLIGAQPVIVFALTCLLFALQPEIANGQSEYELIVGKWEHFSSHSKQPYIVQFFDDYTIKMGVTVKGVKHVRPMSDGSWKVDDVTYDAQGRAVVLIKVAWTSNPKRRRGEMDVKMVFTNKNKMQVHWQKETVREWTRLTEKDSTGKKAQKTKDVGTAK